MSAKYIFSKLLKEGLPPIPTKNVSSQRDIYKNSNTKILFQQSNLTPLSDSALRSCTNDVDSVLLLTIVNYQKLRFVSEIDITDLVKTLLSDILSAASLTHRLFLYRETASRITEFRYNLLTVRHSEKGVPVGIVVIQEPCADPATPAVLGSIYDDIAYFRSLYGVKELFAIMTTYDEWHLYWLNDCDAFATSGGTFPSAPGDMQEHHNTVLLEKTSFGKHILCGTGVLRFNNPLLVPTLITAVLKMENASIENFSLVGSRSSRICIKATAARMWECVALPPSIRRLSLRPVQRGRRGEVGGNLGGDEECFYLLRDFRGGRDGRVWLACDSVGHLAVLKFTRDPETIRRECERWNDIYGDVYDDDSVSMVGKKCEGEEMSRVGHRSLVFIATVLGEEALVMPCAFHCVESVLDSRKIYFDLGFHNWSFELNAHIAKDDISNLAVPSDAREIESVIGLSQCVAKVNQYSKSTLSPRAVALAAIDHIAHRHFIHEDVEYRHFALLPIISSKPLGTQIDNKKSPADSTTAEQIQHDEKEELPLERTTEEENISEDDITLLPIMIDLSVMTAGVEYETAKKAMLRKFENMIEYDV